MSTYRVTARRVGEWWALEVPDLPGVFSQAKRLDQAEEAAREAIAVMLDVEPEEIAVEIEPVLPPDMQDALTAARQAQEEARKAVEREREAMQRAAAALTEQLSQRDAGRFLGVSFQRVHQLLKSSNPTDRARAAQRATTAWNGATSASRTKPAA
ncbi:MULTISPECIES: type II toxin-antitoxin system HicB family antitoxin [Streptomyces]|uniref:Type II toxin-antitoxin system HicB family antitoxin n=1 Tax=Streptomyces sudanensis TaxID=436397 RepID=A0ABY4TBT6_9ACTN|nr:MULTISPECIES: type II toxin-antitoxin system HicB family antitoxin [Streptomyces]URN15881.1 type II toxin-antitoxin system HicB family antitoxin [Streptomyces sudanensis]